MNHNLRYQQPQFFPNLASRAVIIIIPKLSEPKAKLTIEPPTDSSSLCWSLFVIIHAQRQIMSIMSCHTLPESDEFWCLCGLFSACSTNEKIRQPR